MSLNSTILDNALKAALAAHVARITPSNNETPVSTQTIINSYDQYNKDVATAHTNYITQNADVVSVQMASGTLVQVTPSTGTGATTAPAVQQGTGKIV